MPLSELVLDGTRAGDEGLENLRDLPTLFLLDLSGTQVSDAGMVHLKALPSLNYLYLCGTPLTDAGLVPFRDMQRLKNLDCRGTSVTPGGIRNLVLARPGWRWLRYGAKMSSTPEHSWFDWYFSRASSARKAQPALRDKH
jgi:hypothetical protein